MGGTCRPLATHSAWSESSAACPDIERAKKWGPGHLRRSKGEARRAEPTFAWYFRAKASKEANGEARRAEPMLCCGSFAEERRQSGKDHRAEPTSPFLVASDQKRQILALVVSPRGVSKETNTSQYRRLSYFEP